MCARMCAYSTYMYNCTLVRTFQVFSHSSALRMPASLLFAGYPFVRHHQPSAIIYRSYRSYESYKSFQSAYKYYTNHHIVSYQSWSVSMSRCLDVHIHPWTVQPSVSEGSIYILRVYVLWGCLIHQRAMGTWVLQQYLVHHLHYRHLVLFTTLALRTAYCYSSEIPDKISVYSYPRMKYIRTRLVCVRPHGFQALHSCDLIYCCSINITGWCGSQVGDTYRRS